MIPDGNNIRYWPRKMVPLALEAGWAIHPESKTGDWAVIMHYVGGVVAAQEEQRPSRRLIAYAGAE